MMQCILGTITPEGKNIDGLEWLCFTLVFQLLQNDILLLI